jgi:glycosyltransferase involved in cell wall biosynthesis
MKISLLHPSRNRAFIAKNVFDTWIKKASGKHDIEHILSIDEDDEECSMYVELFFGRGESRILINRNRSAIDAINAAAKSCTGDILIVVSDDFDCPENWDQLLVEAINGKTDWILKTKDGIQSWIITMPIMDRAYYNRFGYIYFPDYLHMFCDTEITCVADLTDRKIEADITFTHNHYSTGNFRKDKVSERADKTWDQGEKLFISRYRNVFGLSDIKGKITSQEYLNWIAQKL